MKRLAWGVGLIGLVASGSCRPAGPDPAPATAAVVQLWPGLERTTALPPDRVGRAQSVLVPIYSSIASADNARPINLAVTLTVRNLDRYQPIVVEAIHYHDSGGKMIRELLGSPVRVAPLAALNLFLRESDTSGGPSPSLLVDWAAESAVESPSVEAVMISTAGSLGLTFTTTGRVITARQR